MLLFKDLRKYTLDELKIGMKVNSRQLDSILDTYIILKDIKLVQDSSCINAFEGTIDTISKNYISLESEKSVLIYNGVRFKVECAYH